MPKWFIWYHFFLCFLEYSLSLIIGSSYLFLELSPKAVHEDVVTKEKKDTPLKFIVIQPSTVFFVLAVLYNKILIKIYPSKAD